MYENEILVLAEQELDESVLLEKKEISGQKACKLVKYLDYQNDNIDNEIKRLQELKRLNLNKNESIKNYIKYLVNSGVKDFGLVKVSLRHTKAVEVDDNIDINTLDIKFVYEKTTKTINKTAIKEYLEQPTMIDNDTGEIVENKLDFAKIVENESVIIK